MCYDVRMRIAALIVCMTLLAACSSTPKTPPPESPLKQIERFYAAPVVYEFQPPADWELPEGEWIEKTGHFSEAFVDRLAVTRRAPISRLDDTPVPDNHAIIQLVIQRVDRGYFAYVSRRAAICYGELLITRPDGTIIESYDVEFRTPSDAGYQWFTYGGRLESAHDDFAVEVISIIQRARR
jgi:hypothetical protein